MIFKTPIDKEEFRQYYQLRWEVLRKPWGQPEGSEKADDEDKSFHGMMINKEGHVIAVSRLHFSTATEGQIRFMGVHEDYRGMGIGMKLLLEMENIAISKGMSQIRLHARENAVDFYKNALYTIEKDSYILFGKIQHFEMLKILSK